MLPCVGWFRGNGRRRRSARRAFCGIPGAVRHPLSRLPIDPRAVSFSVSLEGRYVEGCVEGDEPPDRHGAVLVGLQAQAGGFREFGELVLGELDARNECLGGLPDLLGPSLGRVTSGVQE